MSDWFGTAILIASALAAAPGVRVSPPALVATTASSARTIGSARRRRTAVDDASRLAELLLGELAEARAGLVVRPDRLVLRIARIRGDLLRDDTQLVHHRLPVTLVAEQRVDPRLRPVVLGHVVVDEQLTEQDADADVGEGPKREDLVRARDERVDVGVLRLKLVDDRADRLVDQRDPDLFALAHPGSVHDLRRVRQPLTLRRVDPLSTLAAEPERAALFLDVDGVLAPIVEHRDDATVPPETRAELRRLAERYALVACITGRTGDVARRIVGVDELAYVGQHGLELAPEARAWAERIHAFAAGTGWPDLETKPFTVAFHYRNAPDLRRRRAAELEQVATHALAAGFRPKWGRMVLEVVPPLDVSKGTAVRALLERSGLSRALYAGDDVTDLDGFRALDGLEVAVRVAVSSSEGPSELGELADLIVGSPEAFRELLAQL